MREKAAEEHVVITRRDVAFTCWGALLAIALGFGLGSATLEARLARPLTDETVRLASLDDPDLYDPEFRKATDAEMRAACDSIERQLKAFKSDNYREAEKFQSAALRRNFADPADFRRMMQRSYPQFARYRSITFGAATCSKDGRYLRIPVVVTGEDERTVRAVYEMVMEQGLYRVQGVEGGAPRPPAPAEVV